MYLSPLLSFYIGRHFMRAFLAALGSMMGLVLLFDIIELLRRSTSHAGLGFDVILELALLKLPQMVELILPFAAMIGAMVCLWSMTRSRELVVARSSGVSAWQFLAPLLGVALIIGALNVTSFNPLAAALYQRYEQLQDQLALHGTDNPLTVGENGLWLRETHGEQQMVVHAGAVRQEKLVLKMRDVSIFFTDAQGHFLYRVDGAVGELRNGQIHVSETRTVRPGEPVSHQDSASFPTDLTLARIQNNFASPETISFWDLPGFIRFFESAGFSASRQRLYFQSLLASPLLLCGMVLVAAVFSLKPNMRSGGAVMRVAFAAAAGFLLYFFTKVVYALGLQAALPVGLAAWTPPMVTGFASIGALFHLEDG
jgi:lipopolysaccharide export system permease protein